MGNDLARLTAAVCSLCPPKRAPGRKTTRAVRPLPRGRSKARPGRVWSGSGSERIGYPIRYGTGAHRVSARLRGRSVPGLRYGARSERTGYPIRFGTRAHRVSAPLRSRSVPGLRYGARSERTGSPIRFGTRAHRVSARLRGWIVPGRRYGARSEPGIRYGSGPVAPAVHTARRQLYTIHL